jgi:hypothetical protein
MGGSNETFLGQFRAHISTDNGCNPTVHIHDDKNGLKFECAAPTFKQEMKDVLKAVKAVDQEGIMVIKGKTDTDLFIGLYGDKFFMVLSPQTSMKKDIEGFLKGC